MPQVCRSLQCNRNLTWKFTHYNLHIHSYDQQVQPKSLHLQDNHRSMRTWYIKQQRGDNEMFIAQPRYA